MCYSHLACAGVAVLLLSVFAFSQESSRFVDIETVMVVKCESVGPLNKLLRARVDLDVVDTLGGTPSSGPMTIESRFPMATGRYYLVIFGRSIPAGGDGTRVQLGPLVSSIPIVSANEARGLKAFSLEIAIRRTINLRLYELESELRVRQSEIERLKDLRDTAVPDR